MCGIAGWIDWDQDLTQKKEIIEKMGSTLHHRGPDNQGSWVTKHAALAHTRLIVIDPEGGSQPMIRQYGDNKYVIIYNGELYNTEELRRELKQLGHKFFSHSDTEVLLISYIEWGEKCVERLNGIFAFGVWDDSKQKLFMARDRLGVKPLFYTEKYHKLLFASEIKALLAHPEIKPEIDEEGLSEIFGLGPSRTPGHGVFRGVSELKPGHYLIYNSSGTSIKKYWVLESKKHEDDLKTTIEKVRELVLDTVKRQLVSDVPVCTFLSGGLDSSIISAVAANIYREKAKTLHTYSIDYVGNKENFKASEFQPNADPPWVKKMSKYIGSTHHYIMVDTIELVESLYDAVKARDLPGMADIDSSLLLFSKEIKKGATVGLSGECADEIFGGYPWFYREDDLKSENFPWLRSLDERVKILSPSLKERLSIKDYVQYRFQQTLDEVPISTEDSKEQVQMRKLFYLNYQWFMANLLERKDRMTMATGLEVRVPFADHRLVGYVWNIPWEMKNLNNREKGILRAAMKGILPDEILNRRKSPYPKTHNPLYTKEVSNRLLDILNDPTSPILDLIDAKYVRNIIESGGEIFKVPYFGQLMMGPQLLAYLIQVNYWLKEYQIKIV
ncbi:asparagine synthase (glutamine-hydrolyzing) [Vulcanibacillus modesticaldus]|uniref:asparagine synthase (glutamine-hydrolyzing) n=1 Tax=Vulcanibacillus modesticaldus TaxID=337097 RepID=A0A1D2YVP7_9BACI|nr:asparagine synthase (glutamine-hydrolyzing) [Vulcanibacillus modesticaldus]OEF99747.1 asparagine synthase (glutamine-hydrolyzing) [Vulcanibacillus modesticaldus]